MHTRISQATCISHNQKGKYNPRRERCLRKFCLKRFKSFKVYGMHHLMVKTFLSLKLFYLEVRYNLIIKCLIIGNMVGVFADCDEYLSNLFLCVHMKCIVDLRMIRIFGKLFERKYTYRIEYYY